MNFFFVLSLMILSLGCTQSFESLGSGSQGSGAIKPNEGGSSAPVLKTSTLGVVSQRQYLPKVKACLGLDAKYIDVTELANIKTAIKSLSEEGDIKTVNAPMMMSALSLSSFVCSSLIKQESAIAEASVFKGFNFDKGKQQYSVSATISSIYTSCLQKNIEENELSIITNQLDSAFGENRLKNEEEALFICMSVLSSGLALLN